jgi:MFS family permease
MVMKLLATFSTMIGGVISDIYIGDERNTPTAVFSGTAFFGTGLGPSVSGFAAQNISWPWIYYLQTITSATVLALVAAYFQENRGSVLLRRKASVLNNYYITLRKSSYCINIPSNMKKKRFFKGSDEERRDMTTEKHWQKQSSYHPTDYLFIYLLLLH